MKFLLLLLAGRPLPELWAGAPDWLLRTIGRRWGITAAAAHEWLCDSLGCRCAALEDTPELVAA